MEKRSCLIVCIGSSTANRKWINYEIKTAYDKGKALLGIYINKLEDKEGNQSCKGNNPFYYVEAIDGNRLSKYVKCFESESLNSKNVYNDIKNNLENLIEEAEKKRYFLIKYN